MQVSHNYLVLSDLHLSEGRHPESGKFSRNEDFLHDDAFARFLIYHMKLAERHPENDLLRRPWKLIVNGDLFDFLQVTRLPGEDALPAIIGDRELTENERRYGLGTTEPATVWKLEQIAAGHPLFFQALGWFLARNPQNRLIVVRGNHDVELFWPRVQERMRTLTGEHYKQWRAGATAGRLPENPLPFTRELPALLEPDELSSQILFPAWFHYEPGLLYVEHGNQYDPANALVNFLWPVMEEDRDKERNEQRVALPAGSLFVRYLFNEVEKVHPFADNLKPPLRYLRWALNRQPLATAQLLIDNYEQLPGIIGNLTAKQADLVQGQPELQQQLATGTLPMEAAAHDAGAPSLPLDPDRRAQLEAIQVARLKEASATSTTVGRLTAAGFVLNSSIYLWLANALRYFVERRYGRMWANLGLAGASFAGGNTLSQKLNELEQYARLPEVGQLISDALNAPDETGQQASVRYHLFGHDHLPDLVELEPTKGARAPFRQWYVNTGSWLPSFNEQERLTRGDLQFGFFRLIPGVEGTEDGLPNLLEWLPSRDGTRPLRLFRPLDGGSRDVGFRVAAESMPDVQQP
ncbi:MAG: hypothetical protein R3272_15055 [Candidatus Promineifilaceae bacterium]|nr:hypothetical protein [Candidatus Promineifilaceae bacterium]